MSGGGGSIFLELSMHHRNPLRMAATNLTGTSFTSKAATRTEPSGNGIINLAVPPHGYVPAYMHLSFIGTGADDSTFVARVHGWRRVTDTSKTHNHVWFAHKLIEVTATLSTYVGVAASPVIETERFADTLVVVAAMEPTTAADVTRSGVYPFFSPADNTPAWMVIPTYGCEKLELDVDLTGATAGNVLVQLMDEC